MAKNLKPLIGKLVAIDWEDAETMCGWHDNETVAKESRNGCGCRTYGILHSSSNSQRLVLIPTHGLKNKTSVADPWKIPMGMVQAVYPLKMGKKW